MPPRLKRPKSHNKPHLAQRRAPQQEEEIAKRLGGRTTLASGALDQKGDVEVKNVVRLEAKTTQKKSFSVTREMVRKIEEAALGANALPVVEIEFLDDDGEPVSSVCVVPKYVLEMICGEW